jgi:hypothetical protein
MTAPSQACRKSMTKDRIDPALKSFIDNAIVPILVRQWIEERQRSPEPEASKLASDTALEESTSKVID